MTVRAQRFEIAIRRDTQANDYRWYSFVVRGASGRLILFRITNAGGSNAAEAWAYNRPVVSSDHGASWRRIAETSYTAGVFAFRHRAASNAEWIAYSPVYSYSRWRSLLSELRKRTRHVNQRVIGHSLEGRPVHLVEVTDPTVEQRDKAAVWVVARQHPAETGASWMVEGLLRYLLGDSRGAAAIRRRLVFRVVGFMNPDGVAHGNYRVNAAGHDLNRAWDLAEAGATPTVLAVQRAVLASDGAPPAVLFADFHTHSSARKNFLYYNDAGTTSTTMLEELQELVWTLAAINPDFTVAGSEASPVGSGAVAKDWAYRTLGSHAVTLEASYQDVTYGPGRGSYMTVSRYQALGAAFGQAVGEQFGGVPARRAEPVRQISSPAPRRAPPGALAPGVGHPPR